MAFQLIAASLADIGLATASAQATQIGQLSSSPAATIAQDVSNTGTPLLQGLAFFGSPNTSIVVAAGGSQTFSVTLTKPGYLIDCFASIAAAATIPFCKVTFKWQDAGGATIAALQSWYLPASSVVGAAGAFRQCGQGPSRGPMLTVTVTNYDPAQALTFTYSLAQTTQHLARDDWRSIDYQGASVPGYGAYSATPTGVAFGDMAGGVLAVQNNDTLPAHTSWNLLLPLYCGIVFWQFNANSAITVSLRVPTALSQAATNTLDNDAPIWFNSSLTDVTVEVAHPRVPLYLGLSNSTAAGIPIGFMGVMVENCS